MTEEEKELRTCYHWTEWERKAKELEQENAELREQLKEQTNFTKTYYEEIIKLHEQIESKDKFIAELKAENELIKNSDSLCKLIGEQKLQIEKMKCCENCKYNSYWGNELHCNYGLKKALQEDKLVECHNLDKWELKE